MYEKDSSNLLPKLKSSNELIDNKRGHKLDKSIPWLYTILEETTDE